MKKRILSIMLVTVLATSVLFTSCKKDEKVEETTTVADEASSEEGVELPASPIKTENKDLGENILLSVNGQEATIGQGRWAIAKTENDMQMQMPGIDMGMEIADGKKLYDMVKDQSLDFIETLYIMKAYAVEEGIELNDEDKTQLEETVKQFDEGEAKAFLEEVGMSKEDVQNVITAQILYGKVVEKTMADYKPSEEEVDAALSMSNQEYPSTKAIADGKTKVTVEHILISTMDEQGQPLPDDKKAEKKKKAEEVLAKVEAAPADFKALVEEFSEDPGKVQNQGVYEFTEADPFVQEFKDAGFDMKEGENRIVETQFGYHIMRKISEDVPSEEQIAIAKENIQIMTDNAMGMIKYQAFEKEHKDEILAEYPVELNEKLWDGVKTMYEKNLENAPAQETTTAK